MYCLCKSFILTMIFASVLAPSARADEAELMTPVVGVFWEIPIQAVIACPISVDPDNINSEMCIFINDYWGPYFDEPMCRRRMNQMIEDAPIFAARNGGEPHWALATRGCAIVGADI